MSDAASPLGSSEVIAFVATAQPEAARRFYEDVLGLRLVADEPFAVVFDAHGTMLRIAKVRQFTPAEHTVLGWHVRDIRRSVEELALRGVTFARFDGMAQDELGVWTSPGGARIAWFRDSDGNLLSLTQSPR